MPTSESDRAARRRLVWLLLTRGDVGAESLRTDGLPALRARSSDPTAPPALRGQLLIEGRVSGGRGRAVV